MKNPSTITNIALALVLYAYVCVLPAQATEPFQPRLTEYGQPDLQGTWYFGSTTPFTRPSELGDQLTFSPAEIESIEADALQANLAEEAPLDPDRHRDHLSKPMIAIVRGRWLAEDELVLMTP